MVGTAPTGFDGFMAYRTNVDAAILEADRIAASAPVETVTKHPAVSNTPPTHRDSGALAGGLKKIAGWVIGIGLIVAVKACIFTGIHSATSNSSSSTYDSSPSAGTGPATTTSDWSNAQEVSPGTEAGTTSELADDGTTLKKPDIGSGTLSIAELRYCEGEGIRIEAEKAALEDLRTTDTDKFNDKVDAFNAEVEDANSRCLNRSYAVSDKPLADSQIEAQRAQLEREGRGRIE